MVKLSRSEDVTADSGASRADWRAFDELELSPILVGALEAFREQGYHGTSVRDIAKRVGVTVPSLYYHYENKQGMLVALLEVAMTEVRDRARAAVAHAGDRVVDQFCNIVEGVVLHMTYRRGLAVLDTELRYLEPHNREHYASRRKDLELLLQSIIKAGSAEGYFEVGNAEITARALLGMLQAVAGWYQPDGPLAPEEIADEYVRIALRTVGARTRPSSQRTG